MAPINQPSWNPPVRAKHSLFRRDINDGSLVSLVITAIILSILVVGISIWLWRRTWTKVVEPRLERHRSSKYKLPSLRPQLNRKRTEPILPSYRQSMRQRSDSDALWSAQFDHEVASDDGDDFTPLPRYTSRKSFRYLSMSLTSGPAFKPLDMHPIQETAEPQSQSQSQSHPGREPKPSSAAPQSRPAGPRRSMSDTHLRTRSTFENLSTPTNKHLPLRSHPVNTEALHRCSGSFDAAQRNLQKQRSVGKLDVKEFL